MRADRLRRPARRSVRCGLSGEERLGEQARINGADPTTRRSLRAIPTVNCENLGEVLPAIPLSCESEDDRAASDTSQESAPKAISRATKGAATMSDPLNAATPSSDEVQPDPQDPTDPAELQSAGDLDQDELGGDPLEEAVEPADEWSPVSAGRPTPSEQREGTRVEDRIHEEARDFDASRSKPLAETREHELDESVDERAEAEVADAELSPEEPRPEQPDRGAVLEGEQVEPTGLSATTNEGEAEVPVSRTAPEEDAERVEGGRG